MKRLMIILAFSIVAIQVNAQQKSTLTAKYDGGDVIITYPVPAFSDVDSVDLSIYKTGNSGGEKLLFQQKVATKKEWLFADTLTRKQPGVYQYRIQLDLDTATLQNETVVAYAFAPDLIPIATALNASNKKGTNNINISWQIADDFVVRSVALERSRKKDGDFIAIASLGNTDTSYTDIVDDANEPFFYRLVMHSVTNDNAYYSAIIHVLPEFEILPLTVANVKVSQAKGEIVLSWENVDKNATGFYILKRTAAQGDFVPTSTRIDVNETNIYRWADSTSLLKDNTMYQYAIVAESNSFHRSAPSDTVTVSYTSHRFALSPPQGLQIVTANDTVYRLVWQIDDVRSLENAGYAVYFKSESSTRFELLPNGVAMNDVNYLEIPKPKDGDSYYVKAVNGNMESVPSMTFTYTNVFQKEFGPKYLRAAIIDGLLNIKWLNEEEVKFQAFKLYKWNGKTFTLVEQISADKDVVATQSYNAGELNIYKLTAVNLLGEESNGSKVLQVN